MRRIVLALCAALAIAMVGASSAAAAQATPQKTPVEVQLAATSCVTEKWADFVGRDWVGSEVFIDFQMSGCWNGTSSWLTPAYNSLAGRVTPFAAQWTYIDQDAERWANVDSSHASYSGSAPTHMWANVYVGKDWLGVQKWYYPRVELSATGHWSCRDGGGSYWGLSCFFEN